MDTLFQYVEETHGRLYRQPIAWSTEEGFLSVGEPEAWFEPVPRLAQRLETSRLDWTPVNEGAKVAAAWIAGE